MSVSIISIARETKTSVASLVFSTDAASVSGWNARVIDGDVVLNVSKMDGENRWIVDGRTVRRNGFPVFMNGFGARFCALEPASMEVASACEKAVAVAV